MQLHSEQMKTLMLYVVMKVTVYVLRYNYIPAIEATHLSCAHSKLGLNIAA